MEEVALDLLEVLRNDIDSNADNFYDAEADDELDGQPIEIR